MTTLIDGLLAYWRLHEASGTRAGVTAAYPLAESAATVGSTPGKIGDAARFVAADTKWLQNTSFGIPLGNTPFTIAGWAKETSVAAAQSFLSIENVALVTVPFEFSTAVAPGTVSLYSDGPGGGTNALVSAGTITDGTPFFFVGWYDDGAQTLNLQVDNGVAQSVSLTGGPEVAATDIWLGRGFDVATSYWDGAVGPVGLWRRVLTAGERTALYNGGAGLDFPFGVEMASGSYSDPARVLDSVDGYGNAAVTANQYLVERVFAFPAKLGGIQVHADTAGTGSGSTVVDVLLNGTSVYHQASDRPWLAAQNSGAFNQANPPTTVAIERGDRLAIQVAAVSSTGHARLKAHVAIEKPFRIGV